MRLLCNHCIGTTLKIRKRKKSQRRSTSEDKMHLRPWQKAHTTNGENASLKQCNLTPDDVIIILPKLSSQKCFSLTTCKIWTQSNVCFLRYENMKNASLMQGHVTCDDVITMTMQLSCRRGLHSCAYQNWTQSELRFRRYMTFKLCALNLWSKAHTFKFMSRDLCFGFLWDITSYLNSRIHLLWNEDEKKYDFSFLLQVNLG